MRFTHCIDKQVYRDALVRSAITQKELASRLGISPQKLSYWVNKGYPATHIRSLARTLNIKGDEFRRLIGAPVYRLLFDR